MKIQQRIVPEIPPPEVSNQVSAAPGLVSPGDTASVILPVGLLEFLMEKEDKDSLPVAHKTHPMSGIPLGIAIEAAIAAVGGTENGIRILRACECGYESPVPKDEIVVAHGEVFKLGVRHVEVAVTVVCSRSERVILRGKVILVRVGADGRATDLRAFYPSEAEV